MYKTQIVWYMLILTLTSPKAFDILNILGGFHQETAHFPLEKRTRREFAVNFLDSRSPCAEQELETRRKTILLYSLAIEDAVTVAENLLRRITQADCACPRYALHPDPTA